MYQQETTPASLAAFGYEVITGILANSPDSAEAWRRCANIANHMGELTASSGAPDAKLLTFLNQIVDPVLGYVVGLNNVHDLALAKLVRYKQWAENLDTDRLLELAANEEPSGVLHQTEKDLKRHFYRFLFQEGVEFVIETESSAGSGSVDIYSASLPTSRGCSWKQRFSMGGIERRVTYWPEWNTPQNTVGSSLSLTPTSWFTTSHRKPGSTSRERHTRTAYGSPAGSGVRCA